MNGRAWTAKERGIVRRFYPEIPTREIAEYLGRSVTQVYQMAHKLRLGKSEAYMASPSASRLRRGDHVGSAYRFRPGHVPANKGLRRPGWSPGRMAQTQFKKGQLNGRAAQIWQPLWSDRLSKDGYLEIKYRERDGRYGNWIGAHILIWEDKHGPIPRGYKQVFRDGHKAHVELSNLELISNAEMMRRNTIHNLPRELVTTIMLLGAVKRKMRENAEKYNDGSAQPSL
jgi:hypothetical protein